MHADHVRWMGATFPDDDVLVVDLAAPFGWSGSPAVCSAFGRAVTWLVRTNSPSSVSESADDELFFGFEWVDDHIMVEPDRDDGLELAEATLRLSMLAVLGPNSINDEKFSEWSTELQALGLIWNTHDRTVSMPTEKINKCLNRVSVLLEANRSSKQQLQQLLSSLRHLTTCLRAAKPFFQHLQVVCNRLQPFRLVRLSEASRRDLQWFQHILSDGHLEKLPLRFFGDLPTINFCPWLPNDPVYASRQLVLFAVYCYRYGSRPTTGRGNSLQTIQSKISAVAWYHRLECGFNVGLLPHHAMAIQGIHRLQPSPQPKQPVTVPILRTIHRLLDFKSVHDRVLWGATVMGFFFLLRSSEYLRDGNTEYQFAIRRTDVTFYDQDGNRCYDKRSIRRVELNLRGGKNDQAGIGVSRSLTTSSLSWCCPVRALWFLVEHHRTVSNDPNELLCKVQNGQFLQVRDVNVRIKTAANITGQDPSRSSTNSLKIGGATALFAAGVDSLTI